MTLDIKRLSFSFGDGRVLKEVSFSVKDGEFIGLMGPNGSGKTTLLRCMTSYLPSEERAILIDMKPIHTLSARELATTFAVVPQSSSTDFSFTAEDIVRMGRMPHIGSRFAGESKADLHIVREAMEKTDTARLAGRIFSELSGGERQRVVIARAIAQEPKTLLLDEPTVYLDINGQFEIMDLIRRLNREHGITIIAVLHDVNLAARYCDRIALLNQGSLEAFGPPSEVLTPETIHSVYGLEVVVRRDPASQTVYIMPRRPSSVVAKHGTRVHVISGGGTGSPIMQLLHDRGYGVSTGVINVLDSDYETARERHVPAVAEVPFSQVSEDAHEQNMNLIRESSCVIVSRFPVGPGNLRNLEAARDALKSGKRVVVVSPSGGPPIDFVGGRADRIISEMISSGATVVEGPEQIASALGELGGGAI